MKRYGQACATARALDVVGDRWSLLIVRELTLGPRRYRDLAAGLPGIPSNVLAARLKDLQAAGVVPRRTLPAPTDVTVYELTGAGRALQPALNELLRWGLHYAPEPSPGDASQPGWALLAAAGRPAALPAGQTCELRVGPEIFYLGSDAGTLTVRRGPAPDGDAVITMPAGTLYGLLGGQMTVTGAGLRRAAAARRPGRGPARPRHDVHRRAAAVLRRLPGRRVRRQRGLLAHRPRGAGRRRRARRPGRAVADHHHLRRGPAAHPGVRRVRRDEHRPRRDPPDRPRPAHHLRLVAVGAVRQRAHPRRRRAGRTAGAGRDPPPPRPVAPAPPHRPP